MLNFLKLFKKKTKKILVPVNGEVIPITEVNDQIFSTKMMGDGFAIKPISNEIFSPCNGRIINVFKTKHALTIEDENGLEIIVHVGLETVELKGKGFDVKVKDGQTIKTGDLLMIADFDYIKKEGKDTTSMVVITNADTIGNIYINEGNQKQGAVALTYK